MKATNQYRPFRYATTTLRQIVWKFKDVEDLPDKFDRSKPVHSPDEVYRQFRFLFDDQPRERFVVFLLNAGNRIQAIDIVTEGTLNASLVHPREVFRAAIVGTCASIIVAHNHPSGNIEPSNEDIQVTRQLIEAGKIIGIAVRDHIIFADKSYTSFAERGLL